MPQLTSVTPPRGPHSVDSIWLRYRGGRWHLWDRHAGRSLCGLILGAQVKTTPAQWLVRGRLRAPLRAHACAPCWAAIDTVTATDSVAVPHAAWIAVIRRQLVRAHLQLPEDDLLSLAEHLAVLGSPGPANLVATATWPLLQALLLTPSYWTDKGRTVHGVPHLRAALAALPVRPEAVLHVARAYRLWQQQTGRAAGRDKYRTAQVVQTMLALPDPEPYITRLAPRLPHLGALFHPNTLERAKTDPALRGLFRAGPQYFAQTLGTLQIITDTEDRHDDHIAAVAAPGGLVTVLPAS